MNTAVVNSIPSRKCIHCGSLVPASIYSDFCCHGCKLIYSLLSERNLTKYYDLRSKTQSLRKPLPAFEPSMDYSYLDSSEVIQMYSWPDLAQPKDRWMEFYLEGVHCAACVWLTEKVTEYVNDVRQIRLNLGSSIATVKIGEHGSFGDVAREFSSMGYRPHPIQKGIIDSLQRKEIRTLLIRMGVAGACAGNIMLLAVSLYGGATGSLALHFKWISFFLFLPVLTYSAQPFFKSAYNSLRSKQASIDIPIVFGLVMGTIASIYNLSIGSDGVYFDSLSTLVFLLLSTRYLLRRTQQLTLSTSHLAHFLLPAKARKWHSSSQSAEEVLLTQIRPGDFIQVRAGESIPADGKIVEGTSSINCALLTGESQPKPAHPQDLVHAGTVNLYSSLIVEVSNSGLATRLGQILKSIDEMLEKKSRTVTFADQISKIFVLFVVGVSALLLFWGIQGNWLDGINRSLALAIVTCPCTFALATPLAFSFTLGKLAKAGILVKSAETIEKIAEVRSVFFDKTGTLTNGHFQVLEWKSREPHSEQKVIQQAVYLLESQSSHPIANSLTAYLSLRVEKPNGKIGDYKEIIGTGVSGSFQGHTYEIRKSSTNTHNTCVSVFQDEKQVGEFVLGDEIRPQASKIIESLKRLGIRPWILSGDSHSATSKFASKLGITPMSCIAEASPESKKDILTAHPFSMMVGDGANDAAALATAHVGVAVQSGIEVSMKAADIYLSTPKIASLLQLIVISKETLRVVRRNFVFSLFYNAIAATAALLGKINPLFAAVLMPISAIIVFLSSIYGTGKIRSAFKEINT